MDLKRIFNLLESPDYMERAKGEYLLVKDKYEKLHEAIVCREAGKLWFEPNCPMEQWKAQAAAMGQYLYQLEVKAEYEDVDLNDYDCSEDNTTQWESAI